MALTKVYEEDTPIEIAKKIYLDFQVDQSCTVVGYQMVDDLLEAKGELVCDCLRKLDSMYNERIYGKKKIRLRKKLPNSIGGFVAEKIFKWDKKVIDNRMRYTIWRIQ